MRQTKKHILIASVLWAGTAFGDAMPACPPGEMVKMNPVPPGAFHHSGGTCVTDPSYDPKKQPPEPPRLTPEQEAEAKKKAIIAALEAQVGMLQATADAAKMQAEQAKGTPDEAAKNKSADEANTKLDTAKKALDDAKKAPTAKAEPTKEASKIEIKDNTKTGSCAVSQDTSSMSLFSLAVFFVVTRRRRTVETVGDTSKRGYTS